MNLKLFCLIFLLLAIVVITPVSAKINLSCAAPAYNKAFFWQKVAVFKGQVQDIRQARREDFDAVHPADIENTSYATLNVTEVYKDGPYRDLDRGESAWLAYTTGLGSGISAGREIIVFADRGYEDNRFWVGRCNPTLTQDIPDMREDSSFVRIMRSIID